MSDDKNKTGPVVIKKYANRRLYNTQTSSYVTLDHLAAMVKDGTEFEVQDARTGEVLMLGFLNPTSYAKTLESGYVTFWSRTRQKLWMKGESSGNRLRVISASTDCDNDTLLFRVEVEGDGLVCHEGTVSCFTKPIVKETEAARG